MMRKSIYAQHIRTAERAIRLGRIHFCLCVCDKVKKIVLNQLLLVTTIEDLNNNIIIIVIIIIIISSYIPTAHTRFFYLSLSRSLLRQNRKKSTHTIKKNNNSNENDQRGSNKMPIQCKLNWNLTGKTSTTPTKNVNARAFHSDVDVYRIV